MKRLTQDCVGRGVLTLVCAVAAVGGRVSGGLISHVTCPFLFVARDAAHIAQRTTARSVVGVCSESRVMTRLLTGTGWMCGHTEATPESAVLTTDTAFACGVAGVMVSGVADSDTHRHTTTAPRRSGPTRCYAAATHVALLLTMTVMRRTPANAGTEQGRRAPLW